MCLLDLPKFVAWMPEGYWAGLRAVWVLPVACVVLAGTRRRSLGIAIALAAILILAIQMALAEDLSRSAAAAIPTAFAGAILLVRRKPQPARRIILAALLFNLLAPASHVVAGIRYPIFYLYAEINRLQDPPAFISPKTYVAVGRLFAHRGETETALHNYDIALQLDSTYVDAYWNRAMLYYQTVGDFKAAQDDLAHALLYAPPDWEFHAQAESLFNQLKKINGTK
jgi:tetratricopeptide (TPR) repeat protein